MSFILWSRLCFWRSESLDAAGKWSDKLLVAQSLAANGSLQAMLDVSYSRSTDTDCHLLPLSFLFS